MIYLFGLERFVPLGCPLNRRSDLSDYSKIQVGAFAGLQYAVAFLGQARLFIS